MGMSTVCAQMVDLYVEGNIAHGLQQGEDDDDNEEEEEEEEKSNDEIHLDDS